MNNFVKLNITKEMKSYFLGFLFSAILTTLPFILVMQKFFNNELNYIIILLCAITQIIVHFIYFLHLDFSLEQKWNFITLLFTVIIIFIIVFGSIWILYNLNHHTNHHIIF